MFSCNNVNTIVINTVKGRGYIATELSTKGKVLEKITGKHDNPEVISAFFRKMGYAPENIKLQSAPARDVFIV